MRTSSKRVCWSSQVWEQMEGSGEGEGEGEGSVKAIIRGYRETRPARLTGAFKISCGILPHQA